MIGWIAARQPVSDASERLVEKRKGRLGVVQPVGPAAKRGRIGHAIRIFERRHRLFPGGVLHKASSQCLNARQQTVVRVGERKQREKSEGLPATGTATATDADPVVMLIVGLLAAASVANDRIAFASGASPQNNLVAAYGPVVFDLVRRRGKWDKQNRSSLGLCSSGVDPLRSGPEAELLPPEEKIQLKENNASHLKDLGVCFRRLAGNNRQSGT